MGILKRLKLNCGYGKLFWVEKTPLNEEFVQYVFVELLHHIPEKND